MAPSSELSAAPARHPARASAVAVGLLLAASLGCSSAGPAETEETTGNTAQAVCSQAYDWHDFPGGLQCVGGVDAFFQNHFGIGLPALCQYPTKNGCQSCGACEFWVANAPDANVWNHYSSGTPQLFDMIVYPPVSGNAYGHVAVVDHVSGCAIYVMDDNYVAYQQKASCPHTVSSAPYGWYRLKSLDNKPPTGWLDTADCNQIAGWAQDPDTATQPINVDIYLGGPAGSGAPGIRRLADVHRPDLCSAIGSCEHGYVMPTPMGLMDNAPHQVFPYGIDPSGKGDNPLLSGAPKSFTCPPPKIPYSPAIKRHVQNPTVLAAWKYDLLTDLAHLADADLNAVAAGPDTALAPQLVVADDGTPEVWILDGSERRHVLDPASMTAWHFDWNAIVKTPAATVYAHAKGLDWPKAPFLAQGSGPAVYMIDLTTPPPPPQPLPQGDGGESGGVLGNPPSSDAGPSPGEGQLGAPGGMDASSGCSASPRPGSGGVGWLASLLVGAAIVARRRRTSRFASGLVGVPRRPDGSTPLT